MFSLTTTAHRTYTHGTEETDESLGSSFLLL